MGTSAPTVFTSRADLANRGFPSVPPPGWAFLVAGHCEPPATPCSGPPCRAPPLRPSPPSPVLGCRAVIGHSSQPPSQGSRNPMGGAAERGAEAGMGGRGHERDDVAAESDRPTKTKTVVTVISAPTHAASPSTATACLVVIYGADLGKRIVLDGTTVEIGRSVKCDVTIDQESVSRRHAPARSPSRRGARASSARRARPRRRRAGRSRRRRSPRRSRPRAPPRRARRRGARGRAPAPRARR